MNVITSPCWGLVEFTVRDRMKAWAGPARTRSKMITTEASQDLCFNFILAFACAYLVKLGVFKFYVYVLILKW